MSGCEIHMSAIANGEPRGMCPVCMAAEIERLQGHKRAQAEDIMTLGQQVGKLEAEIEQLRKENARLFGALNDYEATERRCLRAALLEFVYLSRKISDDRASRHR